MAACRGPLSKPGATAKQAENPMAVSGAPGAAHIADAKSGKEDIKLDPAQGGITIAGLFENKNNYSGKVVKIRGKITKVNPAIMGKNWIHLQDGTEFNGQFDLTITSDLELQPGSIITIEGKIVLDKDFGYGYSYAVLMEEGKLVE